MGPIRAGLPQDSSAAAGSAARPLHGLCLTAPRRRSPAGRRLKTRFDLGQPRPEDGRDPRLGGQQIAGLTGIRAEMKKLRSPGGVDNELPIAGKASPVGRGDHERGPIVDAPRRQRRPEVDAVTSGVGWKRDAGRGAERGKKILDGDRLLGNRGGREMTRIPPS